MKAVVESLKYLHLLIFVKSFKLHRINKINMHFKVRTDLFFSFLKLLLGIRKIIIYFKGKLFSTFIFQEITPVMNHIRNIMKLNVNAPFSFWFSANIFRLLPSSKLIFFIL